LKQVAPRLETAFFMTEGKYSYLSSTGVRELACFGGELSQLVPPYVEQVIRNKFPFKKSEA
jgi:pantetheine-phosphate adenylyltransferase